MQQKEPNQLVYVQLERCTSREWEITMGKNRKQISLDSEKLVVKERSEVPDQFHSSESQAVVGWHWHLQTSSVGNVMRSTSSSSQATCVSKFFYT